jgi:CheY-like chemotaxis protein
MELLESEAPDAVVLDYDMPVNGGVLARRMRRRNESVPIVMLSGCVSVPSRALDAVDAFVPKSTPPSLLMHTIEDVTLAGKVLP